MNPLREEDALLVLILIVTLADILLHPLQGPKNLYFPAVRDELDPVIEGPTEKGTPYTAEEEELPL